MNIHVLTIIGKGASGYAEFLKKVLLSLKSRKHKVYWYSVVQEGHDNLKGFERIGTIAKCDTDAKGFYSKEPAMIHGSGINIGLDYLFDNVDENGYVLVVDPDVAILKKKWDVILLDRLREHDIVGIEYDTGCGYKNFPTSTLFITQLKIIRELNIDFKPTLCTEESDHNTECGGRVNCLGKPFFYYLEDPEVSELTNIKLGSVIKEDPGWQLPLKYKKAGLTGLAFNYVPKERDQLPKIRKKHLGRLRDKKLNFNRVVCDLSSDNKYMQEFHYDGKLFVCHLRLSRKRAFSGKHGRVWAARIKEFLKNKYGVII